MLVKYKAIIVDDELHGRENLKVIINENIKTIEVVATAKEAFEAKQMINTYKPDIVFLDINMGKINGIELLNAIDDREFEVIYVTAYDKYALDALRAGAAGYILKPIILDELIAEVNKVVAIIELKNQNSQSLYPENIVVNHSDGYFLINPIDIIRIEALGSYCKIHIRDLETVKTAKTLKEVAKQLNPNIFFRVHKSHLINLKFVKEYKSTGDGLAVLFDDSEIKVAVLKRMEFKQKMISFKNNYG